MEVIRQLEAELKKLEDNEFDARKRLQEAKQKYYTEVTAKNPILYTLKINNEKDYWYDYYHDFDYENVKEVRESHRSREKNYRYEVIVRDTVDFQHLIMDIGKIVFRGISR